MGLFKNLFNDEEKQKEEEAKRKAAEQYAASHAHGAGAEHAHAEPVAHEHVHAAAPAAPAEEPAKAPAKKAAAKKAAEPAGAAPAPAPAAKPAAKKAAAKKAAAEAPAEPAPAAVIPHQHTPEDVAHTHTPAAPVAAPMHSQGQTTAGAVTVAHDQAMTIHLLSHIPDHAPREGDPHYHLFEQAKARLKRQGLWKCMINDDLCEGVPELHHTYIEFSQINEVDPEKVQKALGLHFENDEQFQEWAESPGNLEVLCSNHHRAHYGIHVIPGPLWEALRFRKANTEAAAEVLTGAEEAEREKKLAADKAK